MPEETFDEKASFITLQNKYKIIEKTIHEITMIKPSSADSLKKLELAFNKFSSMKDIDTTLNTLKADTSGFITAARHHRNVVFVHIINNYVSSVKASGKKIRECGQNAWRIEKLEIQFKLDSYQARAIYNHEPVIDWIGVMAPEDLVKLDKDANDLLEASTMDKDTLVSTFWNAYLTAVNINKRKGSVNPQLVNMMDFYREVRLWRIRAQLDAKKPDIKIKSVDFPIWTFLYNLDLYIRMHQSIPVERRLQHMTGGLAEGRKFGVSLNGLDPYAGYETYCYMKTMGAPAYDPGKP